MPNYILKCTEGHVWNHKMTFVEYDIFRDQQMCDECYKIDGEYVAARIVTQPVQFTVKPGWWDDDADRKQVKEMLKR